MHNSSRYISVKISTAAGRHEPSEKIVGLLARLIKRTPADVKAMLGTGAIRLGKVLISKDVEKMVSLLERNGLAVEVTRLKEETSAEDRGEPTEPTSRTSIGRPSDWNRSSADWKTGDVIEGIYEIFGSAEGGMGKVYFVFHRLWKMMLAIKTPRAAAVKNETRPSPIFARGRTVG